jgi:two-component system chemotaxis sensor kinase CheA
MENEQNPKASSGFAQDPELMAEFLSEGADHVRTIENNLLLLEQDARNSGALQAVFRSFHTMKGLAGFLEMPVLQTLAHEVENLLDLARSGKLVVESSIVDVVLESVDYLKQALARIQSNLSSGESRPEEPNEPIVARIRALASPDAEPAALQSPESNPAAGIGASAPESTQTDPGKSGADTGMLDAVVRVHTSKLDYMVDMVGELVIAQSLLRHDPILAKSGSSHLLRNLSQLNRITAEIQKTAMSMRMIPVGHLFRRMARLLRDVARRSDKLVELETVGDDTELDRTIIEELADPLMHMIRNSVDHGIEPPDGRAEAGKPRAGHIRLKAYHHGGHIVIEIADDGRGIDRQKVLKKAVQMGLVAEGVELTDAEVFQFIFHPGFSTASKVTDVSGRGVGMDVVRKHIEKLRGRITIESKPGAGTTFILKMPLTLAIIDGLVVGVGPERYVVPIFTVREVLRPKPEMISTIQNRGEMALIRDSLLPIIRICRRFRVEPKSEDAKDGILVVSESAGKRFCLLVDRLMGKQEVVIKSMGEMLKNVAGIAGSAILGDGQVGLILDIDRLSNECA